MNVRRAVTAPPWPRSLRIAWQGWNRFWFEPISTVSLGCYRILYGAILLACLALLLPDFNRLFGAHAIVRTGTIAQLWGATPHPSLLLWFPQPAAVTTFFVVLALAAFCLTIGLCTRLSALLVFAGLVSLDHRNPLVVNGGDTTLRVMAFYLLLSPCGAALSVDRLLALRRGKAPAEPPLRPPWAQRLMQLQFCLIYASTVLLKLKGQHWPDGTALYYTSRLEEFHRFPVPFVFHSMLMVNLLTYWTLATEVALAVLIWVPLLRPLVLLNGLALHAGIEYAMNIPLFSFTMMACYVLFVDVEGLWAGVLSHRPFRTLPHATLFVNGACANCTASVPLIQALDVAHRVRVLTVGSQEQLPDAAGPPLDGAFLVTARGTYRGGELVRHLSLRLPLLWPLALGLSLPGGGRLGDMLYHRFAARHRRCRGDAAAPAGQSTQVPSLSSPHLSDSH